MPIAVPVPDKAAGDVFTELMWDSYIRDNLNKLLDRGHRVLTVAQFNALTGLEDGDEVYLEVDAANDIQWHLRYKLSTTKWRFLGGPALRSEVLASESTASTSYVDLTTVGPSITVPLAGKYRFRLGAWITNSNLAGNTGIAAVKIGAAAAADDDAVIGGNPIENADFAERVITCAANDVLKVQYKTGGAGSGIFRRRRLFVEPERIG